MDAKLRVVPLQHPCHVGGNKCAMMDRMRYGRAISATHFRTKDSWRRECVFRVVSSVKGEQSKFEPAMVGEKQRQEEYRNASEMKTTLYQSLQGINRGIFGVPSSRKTEIEGLVKLLESCNPNPLPTADLQKVGGSWKLIYSTISILGTKRTKLGLRDFVSLEDFLQIIDVDGRKAVNVINFHVKGFNLLKGQLTILASFKIASSSRVEIEYQDSTISPDQLLNIFKKNYDLLLAIFNPDGWLDITYVDEDMRIGRDDKGNLFVLERV